MKQINETTINIGPVRLAWMHVFKTRPKMNRPDEHEYAVTILIPKKRVAHNGTPELDVKGCQAVIAAVAADKGFKKYRNPLKDGDEETNSEGDPKWPGMWFMGATAGEDYPPLLIDGKQEKVKGGWKSGDWGVVQVRFYGYDHPTGGKGVSAGLAAIQFLYHDEPLGGGGPPSPASFDKVTDADESDYTDFEAPDPFREDQ